RHRTVWSGPAFACERKPRPKGPLQEHSLPFEQGWTIGAEERDVKEQNWACCCNVKMSSPNCHVKESSSHGERPRNQYSNHPRRTTARSKMKEFQSVAGGRRFV